VSDESPELAVSSLCPDAPSTVAADAESVALSEDCAVSAVSSVEEELSEIDGFRPVIETSSVFVEVDAEPIRVAVSSLEEDAFVICELAVDLLLGRQALYMFSDSVCAIAPSDVVATLSNVTSNPLSVSSISPISRPLITPFSSA
jgi:hypothetical protein